MHTMPKLLLMRPPQYKIEKLESNKKSKFYNCKQNKTYLTLLDSKHKKSALQQQSASDEMDYEYNKMVADNGEAHLCYPQRIDKVINNAIFIAQHIDNADEYKSVG